MKSIRVLTLAATVLMSGAAVGFAATNDSASTPSTGATPGMSTQTQTAPSTTTDQSRLGMSGQVSPFASGQPAANPSHVGPTGSLTKDAANPLGREKQAEGGGKD